ncbi:HET-domain-containing protein, partial [Trematosphaeria pertusa]
PLSSASDDIRLLQLLPGDHDEPIVCNLFHVESVDLYDYEALSYVWGSVDSPRIIYVNGWEMAITENLDTALRALRHEQECRLLWLDAICIDQSLIPEKTRQVGKMGDIYKAAARVLVFLGPQTEASDTVIDFFEDGYSKLPDLGHNTKAFVDVLFRPWFSRVWVRQEYIRAK